MSRRLLPVLIAGAVLAGAALNAVPAAAGANALSRITAALIKDNGTSFPACQFTVKTLQAALKDQETPYDAEYTETVTIAINAALDAQASGDCQSHRGKAAATSSGVPTIPGGSGGVPHSVTAATGSGVPAPLAILVLGAALLALGAGATAVGRQRGWEPLWLDDWRHASAEASFRLGNAWEQLADRVRSRGG